MARLFFAAGLKTTTPGRIWGAKALLLSMKSERAAFRSPGSWPRAMAELGLVSSQANGWQDGLRPGLRAALFEEDACRRSMTESAQVSDCWGQKTQEEPFK